VPSGTDAAISRLGIPGWSAPDYGLETSMGLGMGIGEIVGFNVFRASSLLPRCSPLFFFAFFALIFLLLSKRKYSSRNIPFDEIRSRLPRRPASSLTLALDKNVCNSCDTRKSTEQFIRRREVWPVLSASG